jgi:hypothetical protein
MADAMRTAVGDTPQVGQLVTVRDQQWVVADVSGSGIPKDILDGPANARTLVSLVPVGDDSFGDDTVSVIWELEPGRRIIEHARLPDPNPERFDDPVRLDAFLDAVRWGAITSADSRALQAPFPVAFPRPRIRMRYERQAGRNGLD